MELEKACKILLIKEPFYGLFLLGLNKYYGDKSTTACVCRSGINTELCVNKEFWNTLSDDEQLGILKHELGHILFKHITNSTYFDNCDHFNIAADCEVNSYIPILQKDPYCYAGIWNLSNEMGTKYYYENIPKDNQFNNGGKGQITNHETWKDFQDLSDAEKELIEQQIDHQAKNTADQLSKMAGHIPGELSEYIKDLFKQKPAVFNWKSYFRRMLGTSIDIQLKKTRKRESIRFPDCSGIKDRRKSNILVAIDTSGSVSDTDLCDFFSEINHIYKAGAKITIIEFDTQIQSIKEYKGKWDGKCTGRGGTDFTEPWNYYRDHRRDYNTFVLFTDGYADTSELGPVPNVIWILTYGHNQTAYPGKTIFIPNNEQY